MSYTKLTILGRLGRKPEMRFTPGGQAVTNMSVATNRNYTKSNGEKVEEVTWFRVSVWGAQAEACNQYLEQGSQVLIDGRLIADVNGNPRIYTKNDGTPGTSFEVTADRVVFLSGGEAKPQQTEFSDGGDEDILPF